MNPLRSWWLVALLFAFSYAITKEDQYILEINHEDEQYPRLNFSSPSPLIFHSVFSLLQQWPNTFFEYGHTIAPCTIPKNTNLYHAHADGEFPPSPEWFGFDVEMSYGILGALPDSHLLTYRTVKDVECLYFDGTSASLMSDGSMDSQMVFIHNNSASVPDSPRFGRPPPRKYPYHGNDTDDFNPIQSEYDRADGLCDFIREKGVGGPGFGYEGVVRMNAGFELIWCNFTSPSVKLVSWLNVSAPAFEDVPPWEPELMPFEDVPSKPPRRGKSRPFPGERSPFQIHSMYNWLHAATKRYGFAGGVPGRGETRARVDTCNMFTFYDPALSDQEGARVRKEQELFNLTKEGYWIAPQDKNDRAVALKTLGRRRRGQRAVNVSESDGLYMRRAVESRMRMSLSEDENSCSGIDWTAMAKDIVALYSVDLSDLSRMLANSTHVQDADVRDWLKFVRAAAHSIYMPYYEYPSYTNKTLDTAFGITAPKSHAALQQCKEQYQPVDMSELSTSENVTYTSISDVLSAICATILPIFLSTEQTWLAHFNNASISAPPPPAHVLQELRQDAQHPHQAIEELMAWLGWTDQWTACEPGCGLGETCYIPMWPTMAFPRNRQGNETREGVKDMLERYLWEPRCVDRWTWLSG